MRRTMTGQIAMLFVRLSSGALAASSEHTSARPSRRLCRPSSCEKLQPPAYQTVRRLAQSLLRSRGSEWLRNERRNYSRSASRDVESEMRRYKRGTAKSGRGGKGGKVKSRKQAIAIGLSKARKKGKKVPRKKS